MMAKFRLDNRAATMLVAIGALVCCRVILVVYGQTAEHAVKMGLQMLITGQGVEHLAV